MNRRVAAAIAALPMLAGLTLAASPAEAQWRRGYGYGYGYGHGYYRPFGPAIVAGTILGLGVGAALAAPYYYRPPAVYAPPAYYPPVVYAPPAYYPPYAYAPAPYYYAPRY